MGDNIMQAMLLALPKSKIVGSFASAVEEAAKNVQWSQVDQNTLAQWLLMGAGSAVSK